LTIEEELRTENFTSEQMKAQLNLMFTANWLYSKVSVMLKSYNISNEQYNVLRILRGQKGKAICQKEILIRMLDRNSNLTMIVAKLKDKALIAVEKSDIDKREYRIKINTSGLDMLQNIDEAMAKPENRFGNLTASESFHLNALLNKMREE
jgi:DNA-binding MarR family transcriptional regulator